MQQTPSAQKPDMQSPPATQRAPIAAAGTQRIEDALQVRPGGHEPGAHDEAHDDELAQRPCGHGIGPAGAQVPVASHAPPPVSIAGTPLQVAVPHAMPTVRGDHAVVLRAGSQIWHGLAGFSVNDIAQTPATKQPEPPGTWLHTSMSSSQLSAEHAEPSSQLFGAPLTQVPAASQRSPAVQNMPSSQAVPAGAVGFEHTPAVHTSLEHGSASAQLMHAPPITPHAVPVDPL
jgi:hypothetical protein